MDIGDQKLNPNHRGTDPRLDALLAVRCQLGERAAFDELIRRWALPLRRHVGRVAGDSQVAEELVQDIWLRVLQGIGRLQDPGKFRPWLFGIAHRCLMDEMRSRHTRSIDDGADPDLLAAETAQVLSRITEQELSRNERYGHLVLMLFALLFTVGLASLLVTEPNLPMRARAPLSVMVVIGLAWAGFALSVLLRRRPPLVRRAALRALRARLEAELAAAQYRCAISLEQIRSAANNPAHLLLE